MCCNKISRKKHEFTLKVMVRGYHVAISNCVGGDTGEVLHSHVEQMLKLDYIHTATLDKSPFASGNFDSVASYCLSLWHIIIQAYIVTLIVTQKQVTGHEVIQN